MTKRAVRRGGGVAAAHSAAAFMAFLMALRFMAVFMAAAFMAFFIAFMAIAFLAIAFFMAIAFIAFMAIALFMAAMTVSANACGRGEVEYSVQGLRTEWATEADISKHVRRTLCTNHEITMKALHTNTKNHKGDLPL